MIDRTLHLPSKALDSFPAPKAKVKSACSVAPSKCALGGISGTASLNFFSRRGNQKSQRFLEHCTRRLLYSQKELRTSNPIASTFLGAGIAGCNYHARFIPCHQSNPGLSKHSVSPRYPVITFSDSPLSPLLPNPYYYPHPLSPYHLPRSSSSSPPSISPSFFNFFLCVRVRLRFPM